MAKMTRLAYVTKEARNVRTTLSVKEKGTGLNVVFDPIDGILGNGPEAATALTEKADGLGGWLPFKGSLKYDEAGTFKGKLGEGSLPSHSLIPLCLGLCDDGEDEEEPPQKPAKKGKARGGIDPALTGADGNGTGT